MHLIPDSGILLVTTTREHNTALARFNKGNVLINDWIARPRAQNFERVLRCESTVAQGCERPARRIDRGAGKAGAAHANHVDRPGAVDCQDHKEGADIERRGRESTDKRSAGHPHKLLQSCVTARYHPVGDLAVTRQKGAISEDAVVANDAVVAGVGVGHPVVVIADAAGLFPLRTTDRHPFPKDVARSNDDSRTGERLWRA